MKPKAKNKRRLNVKLLREIQKAILNEPRQFMMWSWYSGEDSNGNPIEVNCGTAACIAGWAMALRWKANPNQAHRRYVLGNIDAMQAGPRAIGVPPSIARELFFANKWPERFQKRYERLTHKIPNASPRAYAKLACEVIDDFIQRHR